MTILQEAPQVKFNAGSSAPLEIYQSDKIAKSYVYALAQPDQRNIFTTISKSEHRPKRKLVGQLLSDQSMRAFEPTIRNQITVFLTQLLESKGSSVNMAPNCRHLGLDIVGLLGFGYNLHLQTDAAQRYLTDAINFGNYRVNTCLQFPPLAKLKPGLIMDLFPNSLRAKLMATIQMMITTRLAQPSDARHDLLSVFTEHSDVDTNNLRQGQLWTEAVFFFAAGGETIASTLAATFFYLSQNPQCYQKLAAEIRSTFNTGSEIRGGPHLSGCRYLRACIDESLRMSPPVPGILWREAAVPATGDQQQREPLIIDGQVIPHGTQIGVSIYSLHHNEAYFPDPFRFQPERWLEGRETAKRLATHDALAAFSIGSRGCAGKAMAYLETSLVLAMTLWYFDFEMAQDKSEKRRNGKITGVRYDEDEPGREFPIYDLFVAAHDGPVLVFRPRGNLYEELSQG
ncbi:hypothetical protein SLS62_002263 [Diatrype stigma]|uniref:Cytochrome P450 n=1 Tax=Diatrype stigma TaxID=117547 RepID=A0AAN9UYH9_9PEZI